MEVHDWIDLAGVAGLLTAGFGSVFLARSLARGDTHLAELAKQGDTINKLREVVRYILKETHIIPLNPKWDE